MNPKLDDKDADLFREAVRDVKPLAYDAPVVEPPQRPRPVARFTRADRYAVLQESLYADVSDPEIASGEELVFAREGIQKIVLRKLRRGQYQVQAEIDLHGLSVAEANPARGLYQSVGFVDVEKHESSWTMIRHAVRST